jgi:hypothetical protein
MKFGTMHLQFSTILFQKQNLITTWTNSIFLLKNRIRPVVVKFPLMLLWVVVGLTRCYHVYIIALQLFKDTRATCSHFWGKLYKCEKS